VINSEIWDFIKNILNYFLTTKTEYPIVATFSYYVASNLSMKFSFLVIYFDKKQNERPTQWFNPLKLAI
jgi:hypothetical protein